MNHPAVITWLADAGTLIGIALIGACLAYAIALLLVPRATLGLSATLNRRFSSRRVLRALEVPRVTEPFFYRHHRMIGGLLLAGVVAFYLLFALGYPRDSVLAAIARETGSAFAGTVTGSVEGFFLSANALIGIFALVMVIRPSLLKPLEAWANRWISMRQALREADRSHEPVDEFFGRHPRVGGLLILAGSGYVAFSLLFALR